MCILNLNDSDSIAICSLIVSVLTLLLGWLAYDKFLVKKAQENQLEIVMGLLEAIHVSKNYLEIYNDGNLVPELRTTTPYSIFEMIKMRDFDSASNLYFYYPEDDGLNWNFFTNFYSNPLLPKNIAKHLRKFDITFKSAYTRSTVFATDGIIIGQIENRIPGSRVFYVANLEGNLDTASGFKRTTIKLKKAIVKWLKDYGIEDVNLIDD